jgi:hypothetical protein
MAGRARLDEMAGRARLDEANITWTGNRGERYNQSGSLSRPRYAANRQNLGLPRALSSSCCRLIASRSAGSLPIARQKFMYMLYNSGDRRIAGSSSSLYRLP